MNALGDTQNRRHQSTRKRKPIPVVMPSSTPSESQLNFDDVVSGSVDPDSLAVVQLIDGDPIHKRDRAEVVQAIFDEADAAGGVVDPNKVRERLNRKVFPQIVGPVYNALSRAGVLTVDGWTINEDRAGRNYGKPCRAYRLNGGAQE